MEKEPWEADVYDNGAEKLNRRKKSQASRVDRWLTILAAVFLVMVIAMALFFAYLSTGGSNKKTVMDGFYGTSNAAASSSSSAEQPAPSEQPSQSEEKPTQSSEGTLTVQPGEGEAAIAARAGISIAKLEQLNPSHMSTGSWYANPGDIVKIQ